MTDQTEPQTLCRTCMTPIGYIDAPTGGWWAHETHPADEHDAVPGGWVDGDELMEAIAAEVWEHCRTEGTSLVVDDPRNIAGTAAAVARAHAAVPAPATDQAALRDRIAEALYAHDHPGHLVPLNETGMQPAYQESADAVLSVLPAPADRRGIKDVMGPADGQQKMRLLADFHANATPVPATTGRAAVLRELADQQEATATTDVIRKRRSIATARRLFAAELRRMADETQQPEAEPTAQLLALATVLEVPRPSTAIPLQLRRSYGHTDRWAICDREGRRWHREHGWVYEAAGIRDEALRDATRYTLAEAVPLARKLAAAQQPKEARPSCTCQYIAEPWIKMDHAADCPTRAAAEEPQS